MYRSFVTLVLLFATCSAARSADHSTPVVLPAGTQINMYVVGDVSSQGANPGDVFETQAASDVIVDGVIVVRKGAEGQGTIGQAKHGGTGSSNSLALTFDWVYAADGTRIILSQSAAKRLGPKAASGAAASSSLTAFGMAGFFGFVSTFASDDVSVRGTMASDR